MLLTKLFFLTLATVISTKDGHASLSPTVISWKKIFVYKVNGDGAPQEATIASQNYF